MFILVGIEHWKMSAGSAGIYAVDLDNVPWSHGLLPNILWATLFAICYFLWRRHGGIDPICRSRQDYPGVMAWDCGLRFPRRS